MGSDSGDVDEISGHAPTARVTCPGSGGDGLARSMGDSEREKLITWFALTGLLDGRSINLFGKSAEETGE